LICLIPTLGGHAPHFIDQETLYRLLEVGSRLEISAILEVLELGRENFVQQTKSEFCVARVFVSRV